MTSFTPELRAAVLALQAGQPILLLDDSARENEGDIIVAAEKITAQSMNFLIKQGSGVVCLALPKEKLDKLAIPMMQTDNTNLFNTAFTVSIEAKTGVTTGVSAFDRAHTIRTAISCEAKPEDLARPGHVFPLAAKPGGVFERMGHTEGSVDLMRIAGLQPGAVLCELMNDDGSMTMGKDRISFAKNHNIPVISVEDILFHRIKTENIFEQTNPKILSTRFGKLNYTRLVFLSDIILDIFYREDFKLNSQAQTRVSLSLDNNILNRLLSQILEQNHDDSLVQSLDKISQNNTDMIICATNNHKQNKTAQICIARALLELDINNINLTNPCEEFVYIAQQLGIHTHA